MTTGLSPKHHNLYIEFKISILGEHVIHGLTPICLTELESPYKPRKSACSTHAGFLIVPSDWRGLAVTYSFLLDPIIGMLCFCLSIQWRCYMLSRLDLKPISFNNTSCNWITVSSSINMPV